MIYITTIIVFVTVFYIWVFSPLETSDRLGITTAISTVALVIVTSIYAWHTRKMAEEMREQRLSEARPYLVLTLDLADDEFLQWDAYKEKEPPSEFKVTILNAGSGPAINLNAALWHTKKTFYFSTHKGYLEPNNEWTATISRLDTAIEEKEGWLPELSGIVEPNKPGIIAVEYQDIHKRIWVRYLHLESHGDIDAFVTEGEQNIVEIKPK